MTYAAVDTEFRKARTDGDLTGKIIVALVKKAVTRLATLGPTDDQREYRVAISAVDSSPPPAWILVVMGYLDIAGQLASATDAQINTQVDSAWTVLTKAR